MPELFKVAGLFSLTPPTLRRERGGETQRWTVGATGIAVPRRRADRVAAAMKSIYRMPAAARETVGQASRQKIEREFSLDAVIDQYQKLYVETFAAVGN